MDHRKQSLADQVFDQLEEDILNGRYAPGDLLSENSLASQIGVSRTPIREALGRLEAEGLVETRSKRGIVILGIRQQDVEAMFEVRIRIEGLAARRASESANESSLTAMNEIVTLQEFYVQQGNYDRLKQLDSDFHQQIYRLSGSAYLRNLLGDLHHRLQRFRQQSITVNHRSQLAVNEHRAIYQALAAHDPVLAEQTMVSHIQAAWDNIQHAYKENGLWD